MRWPRNLALLLIITVQLACSKGETQNKKFIHTTGNGITFSNNLQSTIDLNILNYLYFYNGGGVALADFNQDGLDDIYFTSNQGADELYINKGNLKFENITAIAGIDNSLGWTTGVTTIDINSDGLLDIYISKVSKHLDLKGSNMLYVNQGLDANGYPTFIEQAQKYGLAIDGFSSQASFFDYDLDGDLDAFILRHSVHPNANYGFGKIRNTVDTLSGDLLLENKNGFYVNVSAKANIYSSRIGYGLGVATGDINDDGYPDIYVGNDFFENDYLYINQKNGSFIETNTTEGLLGHSSHFSMGNTMEDVNNDGRPDVISVDMLPKDLETFKSSGQEYNYSIFYNQLRLGYQPQFMQNTLHLNLGNTLFAETAFLSGIAATDWSWSPLAADFDNDGRKDLYITNGILGASNDMDFVSFISDGKIQQQLGRHMTPHSLSLIEELPEKRIANYFFKNIGNATFIEMQEEWHETLPSLSNGASYSDLDNDGDLDIVVNNINEKAFILENTTTTDSTQSNYLKLLFEGGTSNRFGIGAKVNVYSKGKLQHFQNYTTTGYLSSKPPSVFVGMGDCQKADSIKVVWPSGAYQTLSNIETNQTINLNLKEAIFSKTHSKQSKKVSLSLQNVPSLVDYKHNDNSTVEFTRDPLVPYATTNLGPKLVVGDLTGDELDDIITLGAKNQKSTLQIQLMNGTFQSQNLDIEEQNHINEDIDAVIFDADGDGKNDILVVSGGNEFMKGAPLAPRLYKNTEKGFQRDQQEFQDVYINASKVIAVDIDNDTDQDIVITANVSPRQFGQTPLQHIFQNNGKGKFTDITSSFAPEFLEIGNVYDIVWRDVNNDKYPDAFIAGHWLPITLFLNDGKSLKKLDTPDLAKTHGWWNTIKVEDFDNDGDDDIIAGNWGLNTRLQPSLQEPVRLYRKDFDNNGQIDPIVTYHYNGKETTIATKDELVKQLPYLNKRFLSYNAFAKADMEELLGSTIRDHSNVKEAYEFASMYFENKGNNTFESHPLPFKAQISSIHDILVDDFDNDGYLDALLVGNTFEISTQLGRLDASHGVLLTNDQNGSFTTATEQYFDIKGASRSIEKININKRTYYVVSRNNDSLLFLNIED